MAGRTRVQVVGLITTVALLLVAVAAIAGADNTSGRGNVGRIDPRIAAILAKPGYQHGQWGLLQRSPNGARVTLARFANQFFIPGSTAKLFSVSGTWDALGGDHHFVTPLLALGQRQGSTLTGNLVLVARGDLTMGGRTKLDGTVDFENLDHTYANDIPGATLTPEDPLAGIDHLAQQVRAAGITHVSGNVVVDGRLFTSFPDLDPSPTPLILNDNLIDLLVTPTTAGSAATFTWRPHVAPYQATSTVKTVPAGGTTNITVNTSPDGTKITVSGTIAADAHAVLRVSPITDPDAFGRTALIEALGRAGVNVTATPTGPNPAGLLPATEPATTPVATYVSPPYAEYAKLILKVSHNLGANLGICLMAVHAGSSNCEDGFPVLTAFLHKAHVDTDQVQLLDGRGGNPVDRATPEAEAEMLAYWLHTPDATRFRLAQPILGVDGSLAGACTACPAKGKVFAKTGTVAGFDAVNQRVAVGAQTIAGYLDVGGGRFDVFYAGVNGAWSPDINGVVDILNDTGQIAAILQQDAAHHRRD